MGDGRCLAACLFSRGVVLGTPWRAVSSSHLVPRGARGLSFCAPAPCAAAAFLSGTPILRDAAEAKWKAEELAQAKKRGRGSRGGAAGGVTTAFFGGGLEEKAAISRVADSSAHTVTAAEGKLPRSQLKRKRSTSSTEPGASESEPRPKRALILPASPPTRRHRDHDQAPSWSMRPSDAFASSSAPDAPPDAPPVPGGNQSAGEKKPQPGTARSGS